MHNHNVDMKFCFELLVISKNKFRIIYSDCSWILKSTVLSYSVQIFGNFYDECLTTKGLMLRAEY